MSFIYSMTDTWNNVGTTFNSIYMNASNGAGGSAVGAAASRLLRLDNNGSKVFDVDIAGNNTAKSYIPTGGVPSGAPMALIAVQSGATIAAAGTGSSFANAPFGAVDAAVTTKGVYAWFDTTNDAGNMQAVDAGTAYKNLILQRDGGTLLVGIATNSNNSMLFVGGDIRANSNLVARARVFASLPTPASASCALAFITDATLTASTGPGSTVAGGGGTNALYVFSDGTQWKII